MSRYDDYIRDIPMEIGSKFYPRPEIILPRSVLPRLPDCTVRYDFQVEHRARKAYDTKNDLQEPPDKSAEYTPILHPSTSTSSLPNNLEVLQPSRIDVFPNESQIREETPKPIVSFEEFEPKGNVFDEVEWKSIDDRKALSQILNGLSYSQSEPTTPNPLKAEKLATPGLNLPSFPSLNLNGTESEPEKIPKTSAQVSVPQTSTAQSSKERLRQRLLTKGYRENLVNIAMAKVPAQRVIHIEYYMKGMSILEKRGVPSESSLSYLLDSGVTDKQVAIFFCLHWVDRQRWQRYVVGNMLESLKRSSAHHLLYITCSSFTFQEIISRAQTADQLLSMGFTYEKIFNALITEQGDRVKALDIILST